MFTGIIEHVGAVLRRGPSGLEVSVPPGWELSVGESVAVNGVCLTVVSHAPGLAVFDVSPETFSRTARGRLAQGSPVNLERALALGARLGGHFVTGHVDGVAELLSVRREGNSRLIEVSKTPEAAMVEKGSVALDGISLTVYSVAPRSFRAAVIPHTWENTALRALGPGAQLNIEYDILGKYASAPRPGVTLETLRENGFI
mgnify:CR=1 FL=1